MDIVLATGTEDPSFALQQLRRFDDGSGYASILAVRSGWLSVSYSFFFEEGPLVRFLEALKEMDKTLLGSAILKPLYEPQSVTFTMGQHGHLQIAGYLVEHGMNNQRVSFGFITDQTCLKPLIRNIEALHCLKTT